MIKKILMTSAFAVAAATGANAATVSFTTPVVEGTANPLATSSTGPAFGAFCENVTGDVDVSCSSPPSPSRIGRDPFEDTAWEGISPYSIVSSGHRATYTASGTSLSLIWGSVDDFNVIEFYAGGVMVDMITGADLIPPVGTAPEAVLGVVATIKTDAMFDSFVMFADGGNSFEYSSLATAPIPASILLMGGGLAGLGALRRRKK